MEVTTDTATEPTTATISTTKATTAVAATTKAKAATIGTTTSGPTTLPTPKKYHRNYHEYRMGLIAFGGAA